MYKIDNINQIYIGIGPHLGFCQKIWSELKIVLAFPEKKITLDLLFFVASVLELVIRK